MSPLQLSMLLETITAKWPNATPWPDETVRDFCVEVAPFSYESAERAVGSLYRSDKAKGFRPSPSMIAAAIRDFGNLDPAYAARSLPGGCDHLDAHHEAVLAPAAAKPFIPETVPDGDRPGFEAALSRPAVLGGDLRCLRCSRVELCLCPACSSVRSQAAAQGGGAA